MMRLHLRLRACATLALLTLGLSWQPAQGADLSGLPTEWTRFRLNTQLNPIVAPASNLLLNWSFKTGAGISSSPTIAGQTVFIAGNDKNVYALDLLTGKQKWVFHADDEVMSAPLVYGGTVFFGEGNGVADATMYRPMKYLLVGTGSNSLFGVDEQTGKLRWRLRVPGSAMPTGAIVNSLFLEHDGAGFLYALSAADGTYSWRESLDSTAAMVALNNFSGNLVATAGNWPNDVIVFRADSGEVVWRRHFAKEFSAFSDCPLASDGTALYGMYLAPPPNSVDHVEYNTPAEQHAYALDAATGTLKWDVAIGDGTVPIFNQSAIPMLSDGILYIGSAIRPYVTAIDATSGKQLWQIQVEGAVKGGLATLDGILYFGDRSGTLWAVETKTGKTVGRLTLPTRFNVGSPIIVGASLIIGGNDGTVFALPLADIRRGKASL